MSELPPGPPDDYVLGRSDAETRRLIAQHQLYGPFTRQFLVAPASPPGCGSWTWAAAPATSPCSWPSWSGPQGRVVGVDMHAEIVDTAAARVQAAGWSTVVFRGGDVRPAGPGPTPRWG